VQAEKAVLPWEFATWEQAWQAWSNNGPMVALREAVGEEAIGEAKGRIEEVVKRHNGGTLDGPISLPADYLQIVARKRG
jgi:hypothetical protein